MIACRFTFSFIPSSFSKKLLILSKYFLTLGFLYIIRPHYEKYREPLQETECIYSEYEDLQVGVSRKNASWERISQSVHSGYKRTIKSSHLVYEKLENILVLCHSLTYLT